MPRTVVAVLTLVLALGACGGDGGRPIFAAEPTPAAATAAALILTDRWGDRDAFFVSVASLDAGYGITQILDNAADISPDGTIPGIAPDGPPLDLLSPLVESVGAGTSFAVIGAPRLIVAGGDTGPTDWYVAATDRTLGEIFSAGEQMLEAEAVFGEGGEDLLVAGVTEATLQLAASGYSADQILEALITGLWLPAGAAGSCAFIPTSRDIATFQVVPPEGVPGFLCQDLRGLLATRSTDSDTTTTSRATVSSGVVGDVDGEYAGTAHLLFDEVPGIYEMTNSRVVATISGDDVHLEITYTLRYAKRMTNETPTCVATVRDSWAGDGFIVGGLLEIDIQPMGREILDLTGSSCDEVESDGTARESIEAEFAAEVPYAVFGSADGAGTLTGEFGDFLGFTATR